MERMWRRVNQGFGGGRNSSGNTDGSNNKSNNKSAKRSSQWNTGTASSAGFGEVQNVVAVSGRPPADSNNNDNDLRNEPPCSSINEMIGIEKRRRRRRKSRPRRNGPSAERRPQVPQIPLPPTPNEGGGEVSLKQRAVAKLKMFNFTLNWDLQMTQCKPCGPRAGGGGNILTRRLCRNRRRRDDNELYRSNSFKFERFERTNEFETLPKQISVCDDYSLPVDFVKKRPSSFDPSLAEFLPNNWTTHQSPLSDHVTFLDQQPLQQHQQQHQPPLPSVSFVDPTLPENFFPSRTRVKVIEGYSDPKDTKVKSGKSRHHRHSQSATQLGQVAAKNNHRNYSNLTAPVPKSSRKQRQHLEKAAKKKKQKKYSDSDSGPKSSAEEDYQNKGANKVPILNSPDSISEDLFLNPILGPSPKKYSQTLGAPESSKRNPSPYYYSDLLKNREVNTCGNENRGEIRVKRSSLGSRLVDEKLDEKEEEVSFLDPFEDEVEYQNTGRNLENQRFTLGEEGGLLVRCQSPLKSPESSTTTSDDSDCSECQKRREWHAQALALVQQSCNVVSKVEPNQKRAKANMAPRKLLGPTVCACAVPSTIGDDDVDELFRPRSIFYVHNVGEQGCEDCVKPHQSSSKDKLKSEDDLPRITRKIYETSFDTNINRSDDDLDNLDNSVRIALTPHSTTSSNCPDLRPRSRPSKHGKRSKNSSSKTPDSIDVSASMISRNLENVHLRDSNDKNNNNKNTSNHDNTTNSTENNNLYNPSPPSTAPLPMKFPSNKNDNRYYMNSIKSAPNLPAAHPKLIKNLQIRELKDQAKAANSCHSDGSFIDNSSFENNNKPSRPRSVVLESGRVLELKRSHHKGHRNFSSTESMATSSSGGSMESIRSSTSEGNRSTSSNESRHSSSLSSHSSDSNSSTQNPLRAPLLLHSKLHILSPISDKSSQEPGSEVSDQNRNLKITPEDQQLKVPTMGKLKEEDENNSKNKRRLPQNKNLLLVSGCREEIQGSDSGISIHSRDGSGAAPRSAFQSLGLTKFNPTTEKVENKLLSQLGNTSAKCDQEGDLKDLPFDMPKLRRRRGVPNQDACTSGSATSVDLGDLPFDMPKLRRRLRANQMNGDVVNEATTGVVMGTGALSTTESSGISQASSSHSVREDKPILGTGMFRQNLTLNLFESHNNKQSRKIGGSLDFKASSRGLNLNLGGFAPSAADLIDATIALDRQSWYHGAISRIEAENTLRPLNEGSFLVRNSESTRQDYSLSLKSAKGFMHMRIQRNEETGEFILGQFSRPFKSIPEMIRHFCLNRLPVRGAEHMVLLEPVIAQIL